MIETTLGVAAFTLLAGQRIGANGSEFRRRTVFLLREHAFASNLQMLRNPVYIDILRKGFRARLGYKAWKQWGSRAVRIAAVQKLTNKLGRKAARKGGRAIPLLGVAVTLYTFIDDVEANGFWNATGEAVLDATPIVGTIKFGVDVTEGICDCFSEDEIDANIHEDLTSNMDSWEELIRILENDGFEAPSAPRPPVPLPFPKPGIVDQGDCKRCH
ncbi:MAG: hypothetical protein IPK83_17970 [Planctomycetes bacterium]|nr:hypothetical protein [Planctomycetota bacterium]